MDSIIVQIDQYNGFTVSTPRWERTVAGKQNLIRTLAEAKSDQPQTLVIKIHSGSVLRAVVDALDSGASLEFAKLETTAT